ncbi:MAG: protein translocase subunit SecD [Puniceicoccales bacterium]|jgi:SecD/SecF fusion protein|nr:protein translocase subunit SecD [Puniceicoccales bacterium]
MEQERSSIEFKWLISILVIFFALYGLFPIKDRPFDTFVERHAKGDAVQFRKILDRAKERVTSGKAKTFFLALRELSYDEGIDLAHFFPDINLADIRNLKKKNDMLLNVLLTRSQGRIKQGLDLKGGISCILQVAQAAKDDSAMIDKAIDIIRQRIDSLGIAEPVIRRSGNSCIEIQLPGVSTRDNPDIINYIKKPAKLEFRLISERVPQSSFSVVPIGYELLTIEHENTNTGEIVETPYFVKKLPEMTGKAVRSAYVHIDQFGNFEVSLAMTGIGTKLLERVTADNIGRQLGIVLDGKLCSAPVIKTAIENGQASISGHFSKREATELAKILNNPLEFELSFVELSEIGPSLADDARTSSLLASMVSAVVVALFMLFYYRSAGGVAILLVTMNVLIVLGAMSHLGATLTLPGIAALVLTIGMAVDSNILIFERIREELKSGKGLKAALDAGHNKVFETVLDANVTTLIVAAILVWSGTGPIRGFGIILAVGILATMFCALVLGRVILDFLVKKNIVKSLIPKLHLREFNADFLKYAKKFACVSLAVIVAGILAIAYRGNGICGIDFAGGDEMTLKFEEKLPMGDIDAIAATHNMGKVLAVYQYSLTDSDDVLRLQTRQGSGRPMFEAMQTAHPGCKFSLVKESAIGASFGRSVKLSALMSVALSLLCMMIYIACRFEFAYGVGAIVSLLHDVVVTIGIYVLCGRQFSAPMVASILMIIGYSINDKVIVFDRVREERKLHADFSLTKVVNLSINRVLSRTILTSLTTLLASLVLCIFGIGVIVDLALVFTIGVVAGTFSSIFIASPIFISWTAFEKRHTRENGTL